MSVLCSPQSGQADALQKEELQAAVDAANSAAQQYQRSKPPGWAPGLPRRGGKWLHVIGGLRSPFAPPQPPRCNPPPGPSDSGVPPFSVAPLSE